MMKRTLLLGIWIYLTLCIIRVSSQEDDTLDFIDIDENAPRRMLRQDPVGPPPTRSSTEEVDPTLDDESLPPVVRQNPGIGNRTLEVADANEVLKLGRGDVRLLPNKDGSFELFVLHVPGRESVLVTDSTADPEALADNYTLRAYDWHPTFGDEKRILNGRILERDPPLYFLMDSTPTPVKGFEPQTQWFHIHLPKAVLFGYPWGREGQFDIKSGTWISLRTFEKPNADYRGRFKDNPFVITSKEKPAKEVVREKPFKDLSAQSNGKFYNAKDTQQMLDRIEEILQENTGQDIDIAFVVDTTISMKEDIKEIKKQLAPKIARFRLQEENRDKTQRIGLVLYRDYPPDRYLTREKDFTEELDQFQGDLDEADAAGGYDTPEAVYEGIDAAMNKLSWSQPRKIIVQMGDAIPHPVPKRKITEKTVMDAAQKKDIAIYSILLPNRK
ncbi:MAG: vWA domain-containing protein [Spirochaetia bacterium]